MNRIFNVLDISYNPKSVRDTAKMKGACFLGLFVCFFVAGFRPREAEPRGSIWLIPEANSTSSTELEMFAQERSLRGGGDVRNIVLEDTDAH